MARPTKYKPEYNKQVFKLCLLGADDKQLADFFDVTEQTINNWKISEPEFFESLKKGKLQADARVAKSLYDRALGYSHKEDKVFQHEGTPVIVETTRLYPPDTTAAIFWLKNRQPEKWRDRQEIDHTTKDESLNMSSDALLARAEDIAKRLKAARQDKDDLLE